MDDASGIGLAVRFRDVDANGHVNNAVYATYTEQARMRYVDEVAGADLEVTGLVLATLEIDVRRPIEFGETVTVATRVPDVGTTRSESRRRSPTSGGTGSLPPGTADRVERFLPAGADGSPWHGAS